MTATPPGESKAPEENSSTVNPFAEAEKPTEGTEPAKPEPETVPEPETTEEVEKPKRPGKSASKAAWQDYAAALGHSTEGTTAEIIARIDAEYGAEPDPETAWDEEPDDEEGEEGEVLSKLLGEHLPISAQSGDLTGSVFINPAGIPCITISITGMIGDTGLVIPATQASDFEHVVNALRELAHSKLA